MASVHGSNMHESFRRRFTVAHLRCVVDPLQTLYPPAAWLVA
jgi:hypothetical protein